MKKILIILSVLLFTFTGFSQSSIFLNKISDTELSQAYTTTFYEGHQRKYNKTIEDFIQEFIQEYGKDELNLVLSKIEDNTLDDYLKSIDDKELNFEIIALNYVLLNKLSFVSNGKIFVLTYEPIKSRKSFDRDLDIISEKNLYLYRRDDDGWKKASDLIRVDFFSDVSSREVDYHTTHFNDGEEVFSPYRLGFGIVKKTSNNWVYITFKTISWHSNVGYQNYNSILVLVPKDNKEYNISLFEPENKIGKIIKRYPLKVYNYSNQIWNEYLKDINLPVLYGLSKIEYVEIDNGLTINYFDGNKNKPITAGTLKFEKIDNQIICSGTIKMNKIK